MQVSNDYIARVAHEVNRAYCESIGDFTQVGWAEAPDWQKESAVAGVEFHLSGDRSPSDSHSSWLKQKKADGWKYGPVKDSDKKEHPCIMPFEGLPKEQQIKDWLFRGVVHAMCDMAAGSETSQDDNQTKCEAPKE